MKLHELPEMAEKALGGLSANEQMKREILSKVEGNHTRTKMSWRVISIAVACVLVLATGIGGGFSLRNANVDETEGPLITSMAAGNEVTGNERELDLNPNSVNITQKATSNQTKNIWATAQGTFPLLGVNGSYYRLLTTPSHLDNSLLGEQVGTVDEYTTDPALSGSSGIISNTASVGTEVYTISGLSGTLVAAEVDGTMRAFQRVSFNGSALQGSEKLSNTLSVSGHVTSIELSGVGTVSDASTCDSLIATLLKQATYESNGSVSAEQSLMITLDNGLVLQMNVKNDKLGACGVWSCPEFFDAFNALFQ